MSLGFVMLVHTALDRAAQAARHWAEAGKPIVIHVDQRIPAADFERFQEQLSQFDHVIWAPRQVCEWGGWSIVDATQVAAKMLLDEFPKMDRVYLASGACLPLRSVAALDKYLAAHPSVDFIESVTTDEVDWTIGGLAAERFTLRFPFSWKRHRWLFDRYVKLQRRVKFRRSIPDRIVPHLGSQWWCLTRKTLTAILEDRDRLVMERYFRRVWIPDESYFQTLVRLHSPNIESRSLTLTKFDFQGKPHVFYDDHIPLLRRSNCFVARKAWSHADGLYREFLDPPTDEPIDADPDPLVIDRIFTRANDRRTRGRSGLFMTSRFPELVWTDAKTARRYFVFEGFSDLFDGFEEWLSKRTGSDVHSHLFAPKEVEFAKQDDTLPNTYDGVLPANAKMRDYRSADFLQNLIWNKRGEDQCFMFSPRDVQKISSFMISDKNANIAVISGAWIIPLLRSKEPFSAVRKEAARLQRIETKFLTQLRSVQTVARVRIWSLAEFINDPVANLQSILDDMGTSASHNLHELPNMADLQRLGSFMQRLKNEGMNPHIMGDFSSRGSEIPASESFLQRSSDG